ncbi:MAG: phosphoglycerate kinase [Rhodospirillaceae bacterium]|nr:phosphoglycerate kinase [Rhodospirillaceae bacterium]MBT3887383.1 phosphoglycerate kinase [Rhodospirillaceae bacterium]
MSQYQTLDDIEFRGKRVLMRADLNVPMKDGQITDGSRITEAAPGLAELLDGGASVVLTSHLGRPKGKAAAEYSLAPIAQELAKALGGVEISFVEGWDGTGPEDAAAALRPGELLLLENLRFEAGEEANDPVFAARLAGLADIYVDDAFSCTHRTHASITGVAAHLPAAAGRLMQKELEALQTALENPVHPVAAIIGGNKISTKLGVLENLIAKVDHLLIGGAMAHTFLLADGIDVGRSLAEPDMIATARRVTAAAAEAGCKITLPTDVRIAAEFAENAPSKAVPVDAIPTGQMALDIGPKTARAMNLVIAASRTVIWNGPMGAFEITPFDTGTNTLALAVAERTQIGALKSIAGGGDTMAALVHAKAAKDFTYVSLAGGAFLEWLEGRALPGIEALRS